MWFLDSIVTWLNSIAGYFYDAYREVIGWVWPFYLLYLPLYYLYRAFYYLTNYFASFNAWLDWAAGRIALILSTWDIYSYFKTWFDYAINAWNWVVNAFWNVWNIVDDWWSSAKYLVLAWVDEAKNWATDLFNQANAWIARLQAYWDSIVGKIPSWDEVVAWWRNWPGNVMAVITGWWGGALLDVVALIDSSLLEWFPFYNDVAEFFKDPGEFLLSRLTDWFLGKEA